MKSFTSRLDPSAPPFDHEFHALVIANHRNGHIVERPLRKAGATVTVKTELPVNSIEPVPDVVLLDMEVPGALDWVSSEDSDFPIVALVRSERLALRVLQMGAQAVLNLETARNPEIVGVCRRFAGEVRVHDVGRAFEEIKQSTARVLQAVETKTAFCVGQSAGHPCH